MILSLYINSFILFYSFIEIIYNNLILKNKYYNSFKKSFRFLFNDLLKKKTPKLSLY